jgi:UDP-N-acetylmuramyl pentapeptide phosphotransferase/UDP-N-acetylglucosamine-1-phosphate transferase
VSAIPFLLATGAAVATYGTIALARPYLRSYALAHPDQRSSHKVPTPQGGGIFVVATTVAAVALAAYLQSSSAGVTLSLAWVLAATVALAILGAVDDIRVLRALPRLILQTVAVAVVVATLPAELRIIPILPWWIERFAFLLAIVWFVNLVNFMDGIDWMTVAEAVPITAALAGFGLMGALPREATSMAFALCGAMIGFAPFNRPVARLFLGDVGSLPIGLLLGWLLVLLAGGGHLAAALLLPLYYIADSTITLLRRLSRGEQITQAHRSHFYQRSLGSGYTVYQIVGRVFALNIALIALAALTLINPTYSAQAGSLIAGGILVGILLWDFGRASRRPYA